MMRRFSLACLMLVACSFTRVEGTGGEDASRGDSVLADALPDVPGLCLDDPCRNAGGACMDGWCVIDQDNAPSITCPPAMPCRVLCDQNDICKGGVDCAQATACDVQCVGNAACQDKGVDCGMAAICAVRCEGNSACQHGVTDRSVECRASMCTVTCKGNGACQDGIRVDATGTCTSRCCSGACEDGSAPVCMDNSDVCP